MTDVSCRLFEFFERASATYPVDLSELTKGLSVDLAQLRQPDRFVPWEDWAALCERLEAEIGPAAILEIAEGVRDMESSRVWRSVVANVVHTRLVYEASIRWIAPTLFRHASYHLEVVSDSHLRVAIDIPRDRPGSSAWMRMNEGALRGATLSSGHGKATVRANIEPHHADFDVYPPVGSGLAVGVARRVRSAWAMDSVVEELASMQADLRASFEDLQRNERQLRLVLDSLPTPVLLVAHDGTVSFANRRWQDVFGPLLSGTRLSALVGEANELGVRLTLPRDHEIDLMLVDVAGGRRRFICLPPVSLPSSSGPSVVLQLRDVTEARSEEARLAITDRLATLGVLAASVGHEMNQPLAYVRAAFDSVRGVAEGLRLEPDPAALRAGLEDIEGLLSMMDEGLLRVTEIARDLSAFSPRPAAGGGVDLRDVLRLSLRLTAATVRDVAQVEVELPRDPAMVALDGGRLSQVFVNLIQNAAQAMAEHPRDAHRLTVRARATEAEVRVVVEDTGPGIPPAIQESVFEPFFTTKGSRGTGLGLAVCRRILLDGGGDIEFESPDDGGARFTVVLPSTSVPRPTAAPTSIQPRPAGRRVMVVDDEPTLGRLLGRLLRFDQVEAHSDPRAALSTLLRDPGYDAILCDVSMPGLSGPEMHRTLAEAQPELARRVVFMTGGAFDPAAADYLESIPNLQLLKPFGGTELRSVLSRLDELVGDAADRHSEGGRP